ncbi:hypothetical protein LJ707_06300 [Mucilaginibacter sp. UR6-1]|uniref:hypothetical protein n=1 Tax=Mucilaginibacter sp. UR6-1 TaxID=1435643 RepID=UPI001E5E5ADC|nr:hypothetical protein [Mucilaginibacter sp. UR6-1]MCC8408534.1 hypothetical protein [Mucilaginibacter sp. UR6-1]
MKRNLIIAALCFLSIGASAKNKTDKHRKAIKPACTATVTKTGTVTYFCEATGVTTTYNISLSCSRTSEQSCDKASKLATECVEINYAIAEVIKLAEMEDACTPL